MVSCMREGYIGIYDENFIEGWAWNGIHPDTPIFVEIFDNGALILKVRADRFRLDRDVQNTTARTRS